MGIFDQAYDIMSLGEVICRLPSELAIKAIQRRITDLETLHEFITSAPNSTSKVKEIYNHANDILAAETVDDILQKFEQDTHPILFQWMSDENAARVKNEGEDKLDVKFAFNLTKSSDGEGLKKILDKILEQDDATEAQVQSVLEKAKKEIFLSLIDSVLRDQRDHIRAVPICLSHNKRMHLSEHQHVVSLKAYAKVMPGRKIDVLDFKLFSKLRATERYGVLSAYLRQFPSYRKLRCFDPMPTETEFDFLLFAGSIENNEEMKSLKDKFLEITQLDPPAQDEDEDDV